MKGLRHFNQSLAQRRIAGLFSAVPPGLRGAVPRWRDAEKSPHSEISVVLRKRY